MEGKTFSLYISGDDIASIRRILQDRDEDASESACIRLAKQAAKSGIYQLLLAKKSESQPSLETALRETIDKLFAMVYMQDSEKRGQNETSI